MKKDFPRLLNDFLEFLKDMVEEIKNKFRKS
jgi:hypothetical protein